MFFSEYPFIFIQREKDFFDCHKKTWKVIKLSIVTTLVFDDSTMTVKAFSNWSILFAIMFVSDIYVSF